MSNITIQKAGELARSIFEILWDKPEGLPARAVLTQVPRVARLTDEDLMPSGNVNVPRYEKVVRVATIPLTQVGWLKKSEKGLWHITQAGYDACERFVNVQDFYHEALRLYEERRRAVPENIMTLELAQESAWAQIQNHLNSLDLVEIQGMVVDLLRAMGYFPAWVAPPEKQRGKVSLVAHTDPIGAKGQRILVQVKHKGQSVTLEGIKSFQSILGSNDFGMIVSIGGFTNEALRELINFQKITALDAASFFDLWRTYYDELKQEARRLLPLKPVYFLVPIE
jgi:restriction system protein